MKPPSVQAGRRSGPRFLLAFLGLLLLAPRAVEARCGMAAAPTSRSHALAALEILGSAATPEHEDGVPHCSGPSCSNNVPSSAPAGGFEPLSARSEALPSSGFVAAPALGPRRFHPSDERLDPSGEASRMFHPPRRPS
ncbi:hypothetical protein [Planctomyces sp. SH-PL62]|uniref:hypothetical protein n=1 Tax=Planctomyces sp. SH-PL62 TaxID=1636152 RepID=UPI00078D4339|nr:hypothetical protein [Planctomyces sp. SH-PL62]AMV37872.1 hypothetical protein VT85_10570 [Planctomyces sp. SH-PL62]